MKTYTIKKEIECSTFQDLSDNVKNIVRCDYREQLDCYTWYEDVYSYFIEECNGIGIEVENIQFSGFWSQGDGAAFEGRCVDLKKFCAHAGLSDLDTRVILKYADWYSGLSLAACFSRGYGIGQSCSVATSGNEQFDRAPVFVRALERLDEEWENTIQDLSGKLYEKLESEYEYLTSDEMILQDCGVVFDSKTGERYELCEEGEE